MGLGLLRGHPRGLYVCFATELWERFSYYGMRALLIYYLTRHFLFSDQQSYALYGAYTALAWGLPVVGGVLADRWLGQRRAVVMGAILLSAGHVLLAVEGPPALEAVRDGVRVIERSALHLNLFFLSLALIATGVGFLKTNISTLVGALYAPEDRRRDAGFTLFYLGINLGAAAAPLLCGWLAHHFGWSYGFGLAGIGMLVGLATFLRGQRHFAGHGLPPVASPVGRSWPWMAALVIVLLAWAALAHPHSMGVLLAVGSAALALAILRFAFTGCTPPERDRMLVVLVLVTFAILFWSLYEQIGSSLNLFTDRLVDRRLLGWQVEASQLQALPALFVLLLAPLFTVLWSVLARSGRDLGTPLKFSLGLALLAVGFMMPAVGAWFAGPGNPVQLAWFVGLVFCMVCGELCISPIAMSMVTRLCPKRVVGMMMGGYLLSLSIGSFMAGWLSSLIRVELRDGKLADPAQAMSTYTAAYAGFGLAALAAALLLYAMAAMLRRRMHEEAFARPIGSPNG